MKRFVAIKLNDGSSIVAEVDEPETLGGTVRAARSPQDLLDDAKGNFDEALEKIQAATENAIMKFRNLSQKPDEITMEFGFTFSAEFGAIIARASADANYKVTLNWKRSEETGN